MIFKKTPNDRIYIVAIILVAIITILPIAFFGIPDSVDTPQHFKFADTYLDSITNGDAFPNWSDKENYGYGGPGTRFYPPLEYYFLAFLKILVGNWFDAAWLNFAFWMILGCAGVYFWTRNWFSAKESAFAACFYAVVPFHLNQLYNSFNNFSEFAGASLFTFCFAFLTRIFQRGKWSDAVGLAVFYALLILTHLPLTIIASICLAVYALLLWRKENSFQPFLKCFAAVGIALAASSFYWYRMISEMKWLNHLSENFSSGRFSFDTGFFPFYYHAEANTFRDSVWIIDIAAVLTLLFLASAVIYFFYKIKTKPETESERSIFRTVLPLGIFAFFMLTPLSSPIWQFVTPLQKIQFPARWMTVTAMCGAVVAGASVHYLLKGNFLKQRVWIYACISTVFVVFLFNIIYIWHPTSFVPIAREKFEKTVIESSETESFQCWWAIWAKREALETKEKVLAGERSIKINSWKADERIFEISEGNTENVRVATFYYPHWKATVNGNLVAVGKDENGVILIPVSNEKSVVRLHFQEPLAVKIASLFSLFTWVLLCAAILFLFRRKFYFVRQISPKLQELA